MGNPKHTLSSLQDLGDAIRAIETQSGQPSQLVAKVGDGKYLIGDLRTRAGEYCLEMNNECPSFGSDPDETIPNPHKDLDGTYPSFAALKQAVESRDCINLIGSPYNGYSVAVPGEEWGEYEDIGRIIFPLLQDGEKVSVHMIKE